MSNKIFDIDFFPFGTQYHRAPTPLPEEWEGDMKEIAKQKYTHIQFRPQWRRHERIRGKYMWDDLDRLCDLAQKYKLRVIMKSMLENAPDWVFTELGGKRIGFRGVPIEPISHAAFYVGGWLPCFDNPEVAKAAFEFNKAMASRYKDHPALWFFNAWNEPRSRPAGECRCPHSVASYRKFLQERYGTIDELNAKFGKEWTSYDTLFPPESASDYVELYLWRQWAETSVAARVRNSYEGLKAGAPDKVVMCHVGMSSVVQDPVADTSYDILNAKQTDFYGCSMPVSLHPENPVQCCDPLYMSAWMRRADENYWVQEFYPNNAMWCKTPDPKRLEQLLVMCLACGCNGLTMWQYRSERFGQESNGWAMRNIDGTPTPRSEACDRVAKLAAKLGGDFQAARLPVSQAAILYHRRNDILSRIETIEEEQLFDLKVNNGHPARRAFMSSFSMYRLLGINCDFVIEEDDFSKYKVLHLPAIEIVDSTLAAKLRKFVNDGGTLIISYPFACRDDRTWVTPQRPAEGLEDLTGCREGLRQVIADGDDATAAWHGKKAVSGEWMTELIPTTGEAVAYWNDFPGAAAVINTYGSGKVITCGLALDLGWSGNIADDNLAVLKEILQANGITVSDKPMLWDIRRGDYRFIFNPGDDAEKVYLPEDAEIIYSAEYADDILGRCGTILYRSAVKA